MDTVVDIIESIKDQPVAKQVCYIQLLAECNSGLLPEIRQLYEKQLEGNVFRMTSEPTKVVTAALLTLLYSEIGYILPRRSPIADCYRERFKKICEELHVNFPDLAVMHEHYHELRMILERGKVPSNLQESCTQNGEGRRMQGASHGKVSM